MVVSIGSEGATIDAGGSRREEAQVGFESEDYRVRACIIAAVTSSS